MKSLWKAVAALVALAVPLAASAVPSAIVYDGELYAENGLPYNGNVDVGVSLFSSADGGSAMWVGPVGSESVLSGQFSVELDAAELPGILAMNDTLWLEFNIDGETLMPRQKLTSVPYAAVAGNAQMLGGMPASAYAMADATVANDTLPTNGLGQVSNGAITNEFANVATSWETGPIDIPDFPEGSASAFITTMETGESYLTSITIYTEFTLTLNSDVELTLFPPAGLGVGPVTLISPDEGTLSAGPYAQAWNVSNTPALAGLLGQEVEGDWVLTLTDTSDTGGAGTVVGQLTGFDVEYDVVRSDEILVDGTLNVAGPADVEGDLNVNVVRFKADDSTMRKAPWSTHDVLTKDGCPGSDGVLQSKSLVLENPATVHITASTIARSSGGSNGDVSLFVNGGLVNRLYSGDSGVWESVSNVWAGTLPAGTHAIEQISSNVGACTNYGAITILVFEQ